MANGTSPKKENVKKAHRKVTTKLTRKKQATGRRNKARKMVANAQNKLRDFMDKASGTGKNARQGRGIKRRATKARRSTRDVKQNR